MWTCETTVSGRPLTHYTAAATFLAAVFFIGLHEWLRANGLGLFAVGFLFLCGNITVAATGKDTGEPISRRDWRWRLRLDSVFLFVVLLAATVQTVPYRESVAAVGPFALFLLLKDAIEGTLAYADHLPDRLTGAPSLAGHVVGVVAGISGALMGDIWQVLLPALTLLCVIWLAGVWPLVSILRIGVQAVSGRLQ